MSEVPRVQPPTQPVFSFHRVAASRDRDGGRKPAEDHTARADIVELHDEDTTEATEETQAVGTPEPDGHLDIAC